MASSSPAFSIYLCIECFTILLKSTILPIMLSDLYYSACLKTFIYFIRFQRSVSRFYILSIINPNSKRKVAIKRKRNWIILISISVYCLETFSQNSAHFIFLKKYFTHPSSNISISEKIVREDEVERYVREIVQKDDSKEFNVKRLHCRLGAGSGLLKIIKILTLFFFS